MQKILQFLLVFGLSLISLSLPWAQADQIQKELKDGKFLVVFDSYEPAKGDQLDVLSIDGSVVGTLVLSAVKGNRAVGVVKSGKGNVTAGQKVALGHSSPSTSSSSSSHSRSSGKKGFFLGAQGGYIMPGFTYMTNTVAFGIQAGSMFGPQFGAFLDAEMFSTAGFRFILPSLNGQFTLSSSIPVFLAGGVGASYVSFSSLSIIDPMLVVSGGYEIEVSSSVSIIPRLWGAYVIAVNALTSYQLIQGVVTLRVYL